MLREVNVVFWGMLLVLGLVGCQQVELTPVPVLPTATVADEVVMVVTETAVVEELKPTEEPTETAEPTPEPTLEPTETPDPLAWTTLAKMPTARSEMPAVYLDGRIYVPGGFGNNFRIEDEIVFEAYDIATDSWKRLADIPLERANHHALAVYGGQIYLFNDWDGGGTLRYDPATNGWTELTPPPEARYAGAAVAWEDYIYLVGGVGSGSTNAVLRYDPTMDSWAVLAAHRQRREHVAAAVLAGEIYLLGGRLDRDFNIVEIYNIAEDRWRAGNSMKEKRTGFGAVTIGDRIYAAGGELLFEGKTLDTVEYYDGETRQWQLAEFELPTPLHGVPLATDGVNLYVVGGSGIVGTVSNRGDLFVIEP